MQIIHSHRRTRSSLIVGVVTLAALLPLGVTNAQTPTASVPAAATMTTTGTLDRVHSAGKLLLGYRVDNAPLSYRDTAGKPAGYAITLCLQVADSLKSQLQLPTLAVEWVPVTVATGALDLQQRKIDLLCNPEPITLKDRASVSFSAPIFPGGIAGLVRVDAPAEFQRQLENRPPPYKPLWRGTPPAALQHTTASVVSGSPAVELLVKGVQTLKLIITISTEESYAAGVNKVANGKSDVLFGDRAQLQSQLHQSPHAKQLKILTRHFTYEPLAFPLPRNDDDFRLAVDRALAQFVASPKFGELYQATFGTVDPDTVEFFRNIPR